MSLSIFVTTVVIVVIVVIVIVVIVIVVIVVTVIVVIVVVIVLSPNRQPSAGVPIAAPWGLRRHLPGAGVFAPRCPPRCPLVSPLLVYAAGLIGCFLFIFFDVVFSFLSSFCVQ